MVTTSIWALLLFFVTLQWAHVVSAKGKRNSSQSGDVDVVWAKVSPGKSGFFCGGTLLEMTAAAEWNVLRRLPVTVLQ